MDKLENIPELERANPLRVIEFCYEFGCPTEWYREYLTDRDVKRGKVQYKCEACHSTIMYPLRMLSKEEKR